MNSIILNNLRGITSDSIEKYLILTGWEHDVSVTNPQMWVFYKSDDPSLRLAVPSSDTNKDFYARVYSLVEILSELDQRSIEDIINSLKSAYTDRIQFRIVAESSKMGTVPLGYAAQCVEALKNLVLYAACAEEKAQPVCARTCNSAKNCLDKFQFAQTEYGSFIFNVDVKVAEAENEQYFFPEVSPEMPEPQEHKIVKRIQTAIDQIDKVANREIQLSEIIDTAYENGITANMCDAISMLRPDDMDVSVETTFHFAEAITHSTEVASKSTLDNVHFLFVDEISKRYRDVTLVEDVKLTGTIKMLSKDTSPDGDEPEHTVRLLSKVDNKMRSIKLTLSPKDHKMACDAYRDDQEVEVSGTLDKSGSHWFFSNIEEFKVVE